MSAAEQTERHLHRCQNCGQIWGHGNMMQRDVEAHKCPKCGKQEWRVYSGLQDGEAKKPAQATEKTFFLVHANYRLYVQAMMTVAVVVLGSILLGNLIADWLGESIGSLARKSGG